MSKPVENSTVVIDETPEKSSKLVLSPKHKKIAKIAAAVTGAAALLAVGYKLKENDVFATASEAVEAAVDVITD